MKKIRIGSSLMKAVTKGMCPKRIKAEYIDGMERIGDGKSLNYGKYFEYHAIGATAKDKEIPTIKLLKNGNPSKDQIRIDEQVIAFKEALKQNGVVIGSIQTEISVDLNQKYRIAGILDFVGSIEDQELGPIKTALHDLKLTGSIHNTFGDFCWGRPENMDHTQALLYSFIWTKLYGKEAPFYYWIFDYKPNPEWKLLRKTFNLEEIQVKIRGTVERLDYYENADWFTKPSYDGCKTCPLTETCDKFKGNKAMQVI